MERHVKTIIFSVAGSLVTGLFLMGFFVIAADHTPVNQGVIPYQGYMEQDGKPVNGDVRLHFCIYDTVDATVPAWDKVIRVPVFSGHFTATLGGDNRFLSLLNKTTNLYLGISVVTNNGDVKLSNRQRLMAMPYTVQNAAAPVMDMKVGNQLQINGSDLHLGFDDHRTACTQRGTDHACRALTHTVQPVKDGNGIDQDRATLALNAGGDYDGGVVVHNSNYWHADANSSSLTVQGMTNNGVSAPLKIIAKDQAMLIDGSQMDALNGTLNLNRNTGGTVKVGSTSHRAGLDVSGNATISRDLTVNGDLYLKTNLFEVKRYTMGSDTTKQTGYTTANWFCVIAGAFFGAGDIDEVRNDGQIMTLYTYQSGGYWKIKADFKSEHHHEIHHVGILCVRKGYYAVTSSWF